MAMSMPWPLIPAPRSGVSPPVAVSFLLPLSLMTSFSPVLMMAMSTRLMCSRARSAGDSRPAAVFFSSPALKEGIVYIGSGDSFFYALDADTGQLLWRTSLGGGILSSPALAGDLVIVGSSDGRLYAVQQQDGTIVWDFLTSDRMPVWTSPAVVDGRIYFGAHDGNVYALEGKQ